MPDAQGHLTQFVFQNVIAGQLPVLTFNPADPYRLSVSIGSGGSPVAPSISPVDDPPPSIVGVVQQIQADQVCVDVGKTLGLWAPAVSWRCCSARKSARRPRRTSSRPRTSATICPTATRWSASRSRPIDASRSSRCAIRSGRSSRAPSRFRTSPICAARRCRRRRRRSRSRPKTLAPSCRVACCTRTARRFRSPTSACSIPARGATTRFTGSASARRARMPTASTPGTTCCAARDSSRSTPTPTSSATCGSASRATVSGSTSTS